MTHLDDVARPAPPATNFSKPYWEGTREKKLLIQYCPDSGNYQFFPRPVSVKTGRARLEWREVSGDGEVYAWTVTRRAPEPFRGAEPFIVATIELKEGVRIMTNVANCEIANMHIGMKVVPCWAPLPNGTNLLMFQPKKES
jgi:uncharacterized protein